MFLITKFRKHFIIVERNDKLLELVLWNFYAFLVVPSIIIKNRAITLVFRWMYENYWIKCKNRKVFKMGTEKCQFCDRPWGHFVVLSHFVNLAFCLLDNLLTFTFVHLSFGQLALFCWIFVMLTFYQLSILFTCHFVILLFH